MMKIPYNDVELLGTNDNDTITSTKAELHVMDVELTQVYLFGEKYIHIIQKQF